MNSKGTAYALASAIYAGTCDAAVVDTDMVAARIYDTLDGTPLGTDEFKADLYAQLAEKLTARTSFERAVNIIEAAINDTTAHLGHG